LDKDYLRDSLSTNGRKLMENYTVEKWSDKFLKEIKE